MPQDYVVMPQMRAPLDIYCQRYKVGEGPGDPHGFSSRVTVVPATYSVLDFDVSPPL